MPPNYTVLQSSQVLHFCHTVIIHVLPISSFLFQCYSSYLFPLNVLLLPLSFLLAPCCSLFLFAPHSSLSWCPVATCHSCSFRRHILFLCMAQLPLMNGLFGAPFFLIPLDLRCHQSSLTSSSFFYYDALVISLRIYIRRSLVVFFYAVLLCPLASLIPLIVIAPLPLYFCFPPSRPSAARSSAPTLLLFLIKFPLLLFTAHYRVLFVHPLLCVVL